MARLEPLDLSFFESAPKVWAQQWDINVPAAQFWQDLAGDNPLHWCRDLKVTWTSPRPFGVGTTRHVRLLGALHADEHFFLWEEGVRFAFHLTRANAPLFRRLGEYYEVEPTGENSCRFTWKIAAEPTRLGAPGGPINNVVFGRLFQDTTNYVAMLNG